MGENAKLSDTNGWKNAADKTRPSQSNAVVGCCDPAKHLVLGFFFDGTGNNEKFDNEQADKDAKWAQGRPDEAEMRKQCEDKYKEELQATQEEARYREEAARLWTARMEAEREEPGLHMRMVMMEKENRPAYQQGEATEDWLAVRKRMSLLKEQAEAAETQAAEARRQKERLHQERDRLEAEQTQESPGVGGPTNVAKLYELYPKNDPSKHIYKFYIRGVGTVTEAKSPDDYQVVEKVV